ncbi:hypothetical protein FK220_007430 [Flavobacteriaceae bacterium TP-CH-4]|uniref:DUF6434 domain-containing protein n=1 Tax=Pelagihabitans pacificus TaxID=2696054 RepID=A0A967ARS0_9FLAO|nr:DUF6434 domain-containing protein [Pelagihabitans pacificus]NHF59166.1 hypothetical protein [Pelagihabitans pacificus]
MKNDQRPLFEDIKSGTEFKRWYWLKEELVDICKHSNLPYSGGKFELQDRIAYALDNNGELLQKTTLKKDSKFDWAKANLTLETIITDNVTFGPNFRRFMKDHIGRRFSCHSDFMDWVKSNSGKTLKDAIEQWKVLEDRKKNPNFKREIADHNMYNQYTRDFLKDNPGTTIRDAKKYWLLKRQLPTDTGFIRYEPSDLKL